MEELRIKCPSCGIILDVRNSKNEAVKRITCPNCKKQLAVTFRDEPQAPQFVEIKMVQLADGSSKTILRVLTDGHLVKVNGEQLQKGDEVVLSVGDQLQIDGQTSVFGSQTGMTGKEQQPADSHKDIHKDQSPVDKEAVTRRSPWPAIVGIVCAVLLAAGVWMLWPKQTKEQTIAQPSTADTIIRQPVVHSQQPTAAPAVKPAKKVISQKDDDSRQPVHTDINSLSNYELEKRALSGSVEAQCLLGKRWVAKNDSVNVVKGLNYLRLAAQSGSPEARKTLRTVYAALQQSAANGSTTAANILKEQR